MLTDRRKFLQLLASSCAVAACPEILLPANATINSAQMAHASVRRHFDGPDITLLAWLTYLYGEVEQMTTVNVFERGAVPPVTSVSRFFVA